MTACDEPFDPALTTEGLSRVEGGEQIATKTPSETVGLILSLCLGVLVAKMFFNNYSIFI